MSVKHKQKKFARVDKQSRRHTIRCTKRRIKKAMQATISRVLLEEADIALRMKT